VAAVQRHERPADGGQRGRQLVEVGGRDAAVEAVGRQHVVEVGDQADLVVLGQERHVEAEGLVQPDQQGHRERPLVVLQLVEVAGRDGEALGECGLGQPVLVAQRPQAGADERLAHVTPV
jgi:hypothetical protein